MLQTVLKVVGGKQDGKLIPLNTKKFLIGREQDCHLRPGSESVSRHHCAITIDDFTVRIRDLGSSNGTSINGKRIIGVHEAKPGDALQVGNLDFEIVFNEVATPGTTGAPEKGGTSFVLDDFNLEAAEPLSDTAMMIGSDTAVISKNDLETADTKSKEELASTEEQHPSTPSAEVTTSEQSTDSQADDQQPVDGDSSALADTVAAEASAPELAQPAAETPAAVQQPPVQQPGYPQQPASPAMPGYGQSIPQQPYPYGMPQQGMPQPGMPGYGMPQQGYPYGVPQPGVPQPGMPGYGMAQPGMPGYGMPQQPVMPGYGVPQPAMPYPAQQMPYPTDQPVDDYDEDEVDDSSKVEEPPIALPDPSETGAVDEVKTAADDGPKVEAPNPAADILKKYMGGR